MKSKKNTSSYSELPFPPKVVVKDRLTSQDGNQRNPQTLLQDLEHIYIGNWPCHILSVATFTPERWLPMILTLNSFGFFLPTPNGINWNSESNKFTAYGLTSKENCTRLEPHEGPMTGFSSKWHDSHLYCALYAHLSRDALQNKHNCRIMVLCESGTKTED